jgi:hypothetical protein
MVSRTPSDVIAAMEKALVYIAENIPEYYPFSYFLKTTPIVYKKDLIAATDGKDDIYGSLGVLPGSVFYEWYDQVKPLVSKEKIESYGIYFRKGY